MRCICPPLARCSFVLILALRVVRLVAGGAVNRTIDDVRGDSATGALVQYLPQVPASSKMLWFNQTSCAGCADVPDASQTFDGTWTAALYQADIGSLSVTMKFTGTAIYVFFVVPNFLADSGLASSISCEFFVDSVAVGTFDHQSNGSGAFEYNSLVYQNVTLPDGDHVLLIETKGADAAIIIFDYAIYT
ncbi:hypothetical protein C8F04DRAFT_954130 [Mycena alexandri]|uniref:Uncharacterized protein n=1 Tax=Mycena alexandri TaxID=1745969 RepID=A0AAD6SYE6_9AGAR|nr:hypothetical protein C8F04DRAFT_954130 [Mycena alexandri]